MKNRYILALITSLVIWSFSCKEDEGDEEQIDPVTAGLVEILDQELVPLSPDPIQWTNSELQFLDEVSDHSIVALGEATHGTAEFFKAKHRIFKYLVENHGFKIFAIEADFGESILINEAVLKSDKSEIEDLMKRKMHFWTWRTNEVRDMLYWMCDYNVGKAETEKVQYWGVDCQFNTYHPDMVREALEASDVPFRSFAEGVLYPANSESITGDRFSGYTEAMFTTYLGRIAALKDSITKYEADIVDARLTLQLVALIEQVSEVMYYSEKNVSKNYRDEYMAKNTAWLHTYFNDAKIVLWAHNFHVSDHSGAGSMGYHLKTDFPNEYTSLGFLFSKGFFTAVTQSGTQFNGINQQALEKEPKSGSLNDMMFRAEADVFTVALSDLQNHDEWIQAFFRGIEFFQMGSVYNNNPSDYYSPFNAAFFDRLIYFERTTASVALK